MSYLPRIVDSEIDELFSDIPAIALDGPKAVGKTTTAVARAKTIIRLDDVAQATVIANDPSVILRKEKPLLLDEWQKVPTVWDVVRRAVDDDYSGGQFLLAGSASLPDDATSHSGAGRIGRLRMRPMTLTERGVGIPKVALKHLLKGKKILKGETDVTLEQYAEEIVASGFPGMRGLKGRALRFQMDSYIRNAVERDVTEYGVAVRRPEMMLSWLKAYAAATASTTSYSRILDAATPGETDKPSKTTASTYRDALAALWLLDPVPAWLPGGGMMTRLGAAPKHHLADPALAANLLGLTVDSLLDGKGKPLDAMVSGGMLGPLFESLATLCIRVSAQAAEARVSHMRTRNGDHEIDLIIARPDGRVLAVEIKTANAVSESDGKHLRWLRDKIGDQLIDAIIVNTGPVAYRRKDGIGVVPLALLG